MFCQISKNSAISKEGSEGKIIRECLEKYGFYDGKKIIGLRSKTKDSLGWSICKALNYRLEDSKLKKLQDFINKGILIFNLTYLT